MFEVLTSLPTFVPIFASMEFNIKGLLFLIGAVIFGLLSLTGFFYTPHRDALRASASAGWCLGFVALFIWASGG